MRSWIGSRLRLGGLGLDVWRVEAEGGGVLWGYW